MLRRFRSPRAIPPPQVGTIARIRGLDLHWIEIGKASGASKKTLGEPPVVLLHGLGDSHRTWSEVAPALARSRRVLMLDLGGHGLSSRPDASYSLDWHARTVGAWLAELGLDQVDLVGHSYGGGVAQWMLLEHAHRVRKLALVAAGGLGREVNLALRLAAIPHLVERIGQPFMAPGTFVALHAAGGTYSTREVAQLSWMNGRRGTARAFARSVRDVIDLRGQRRGFFQRAHEIPKLPTIGLFWGEDDPVIPIAHAIEAAPLMNGASLTRFTGCGHYPHREKPEQFVAALETFLDADAVDAGVDERSASSAPPPSSPESGMDALARSQTLSFRASGAVSVAP